MASSEAENGSAYVPIRNGGFETSRFTKTAEELKNNECLCHVCLDVYHLPKELPCRHVFCKPCILKICVQTCDNDELRQAAVAQTTALESTIHKCPFCNGEFQYSDIKDVCYNFKHTLDELEIKCEFEGCSKKVKLDNLDVHEMHCEFNPEREVECRDCNEKLRYSELKRNHRCSEGHMRKLQEFHRISQETINELDKQKRMLED